MRSFFYIILLFGVFSHAQQPAENRFSKAENEETTKSEQPVDQGDAPNVGPGNPGDDVPIDNQLPFLILSAMVLLGIITIKKRKMQL